MLDAKFFRRVGPNVRDRYRKHIFQDAKDVFGKPFKAYSTNKTKWASILARKNERKKIPKEGLSYGEAKRMGILKRQASQYKNKTSPVLTSDLLRDYGLIRTSNNRFVIGWSTLGDRINHLRDMGRVLTDKIQPLPKKVINYLNSEVDKEIKKQFPKDKKVVIKIKK